MTLRSATATTMTTALALVAALFAQAAGAQEAPLAFSKATVTIDGTSNIHDWSAATSTVRLTRAQVAAETAGDRFWDAVVKPGALEAFAVSIPAASLTSPKSGLDKNMHKALKVEQYKDITFTLQRLTATPKAGAFTATGLLRVAGVEKPVTLTLALARAGDALAVTGSTDVLMTDFGIDPPRALLGTIRSSPKVTVSFQAVLSSPLT